MPSSKVGFLARGKERQAKADWFHFQINITFFSGVSLEHPQYPNSTKAQLKSSMTSHNQPFGLGLGWLCEDIDSIVWSHWWFELSFGSLGVLGKPCFCEISSLLMMMILLVLTFIWSQAEKEEMNSAPESRQAYHDEMLFHLHHQAAGPGPQLLLLLHASKQAADLETQTFFFPCFAAATFANITVVIWTFFCEQSWSNFCKLRLPWHLLLNFVWN